MPDDQPRSPIDSEYRPHIHAAQQLQIQQQQLQQQRQQQLQQQLQQQIQQQQQSVQQQISDFDKKRRSYGHIQNVSRDTRDSENIFNNSKHFEPSKNSKFPHHT
jgi:hypothetical protein